jgi:putative nucleotidyltransferase with HDIG domain
MSQTDSRLPASGRVLVGAVGLAGLGVVLYSLVSLVHDQPPLQWVAFSLLTFATGALTLKIPSTDMRFSMSEVFAFSCVLLYGPEMAVATVGIDVLLLSWRLRHTLAQTIFNFGDVTLCVWISGSLFFAAADIGPLYSAPLLTGWVLLPLCLMAATYFLINSILAATVIGCHTHRSPLAFWREHFVGLIPTYAAGASVSLLLVVALRQVHFSAIFLIPPLLLVTYLTMRSSFGRVEDSKRHVEKLNLMYLSTVETLATAIDAKDEVTHGHIRRVQGAAVGLARELGITDEETLKAIEAGGLLHDTGKIAVPEHILNKPGKLTPAEFEKMKLHAPIGAEILSSIDFPYPVVPIVRHHHENWDGTGYPDGLRGTDIPIGARILSVVDCFDALTSDRPYRSRMTNEVAIAILLERRGTMYDPAIVDAFVGAHGRLMPAETTMHPAARAVGGARSRERSPSPAIAAAGAAIESSASEEVLGVSSLARALGGEATVADAGALSWMMLKQVLPCTSMGLFVPDEPHDLVVGCYAAGNHAGLIRSLHAAPGDGIVGWVAGHQRTAVNAEPALDFGASAAALQPPLLSALAVPLVHDGLLVAVLAVYASNRGAFSEDHARLLDLMAPRLAASIAAVAGRDAANLDMPHAVAPRSRTSPRTPSDLTLLKGRRATG